MEAIRYENSEIDERIIRAVTEIGYEEMTPIQQSAIPALLEGRDIIGQAQTGTGKTAAFGIPLVQMIDPEDERVQAIVLCPTRELAIQAADELRRYAKYLPGVKVLPVYGGQDIEKADPFSSRKGVNCCWNTGKSYGSYEKTYVKA